jgi:hypothetical protein
MVNPETLEMNAVNDVLQRSGGGNVDVQSYQVARGLTRVNIQSDRNYGYDTTPTPFKVLMGFLSGVMIVGIGSLILAIAVGAALLVLNTITLDSLTPALITKSFHIWVVVSLLSGVAVALYDLMRG